MIIDPSGRGPTRTQLLVAGGCGLVVLAIVFAFLFARYQGYFVPKVKVTAELTTTGDGLPSEADVKFRGVLVGTVETVEVAARGELQKVDIELKPEFAEGIPSTVTARVVPSNLFAVTSVELVFNGPADEYLSEGDVIPEDRSQGTIALQDTLTAVRNVLDKIDPIQFGRVLGTLQQALDGSGRMPGSSIERIDRWLTEVDASIPDLGVMLGDVAASAYALNQSAPELLDVLGSSVETARTIADRRDELTALILGADSTVDTVNELFARNPDAGKEVTAGTSDTFGALAADPNAITQAIFNLGDSATKLNTVFTWGPQMQMVWDLAVTFTPYRPNTVADCPRYGELAGPSCFTAPAEVELPPMPESLRPQRLASADGLPPVIPVPGMPLLPGLTSVTIPAPEQTSAIVPPFAGTPLEGLFPQVPALTGIPGIIPGVPGAAQPAPEAAPAAATEPAAATDRAATTPAAAPIAYRGRDAMELVLGHTPTASEYLLLSTIMRNGTVQVTDNGGGR